MPGNAYTDNGPVDCSIQADRTQCKGKSVIVTGGSSCSSLHLSTTLTSGGIQSITDRSGAQGIGEAYVRSFVEAGYVMAWVSERTKVHSQLSPAHS